jgi:hypothetical protein
VTEPTYLHAAVLEQTLVNLLIQRTEIVLDINRLWMNHPKNLAHRLVDGGCKDLY